MQRRRPELSLILVKVLENLDNSQRLYRNVLQIQPETKEKPRNRGTDYQDLEQLHADVSFLWFGSGPSQKWHQVRWCTGASLQNGKHL